MNNLFINASNIHNGGGAVLLKELLSTPPKGIKVFLLHDSRLIINYSKYENIIFRSVKPNIFSRIYSDYWIYKNSQKEDFVLCFGNLPTFFKLRSFVILFLQNRFLIDEINSIRYLNFQPKIRNIYERIIFLLFKDNVDKYIVQSQTMEELLKKNFNKDALKMSFLSSNFLKYDKEIKNLGSKKYDFIYVASEDIHKNHKNLIQAWIILSRENIYPSLLLTLKKNSFNRLIENSLDKKVINKLRIYNIEPKKDANIYEIFSKGEALIFPSLIESYGLPLMEAKQLGMKIIASELDYVRDIVDPDFTFDPYSPKSISRSVKRYLQIQSNLDMPISSKTFIKKLINKES